MISKIDKKCLEMVISVVEIPKKGLTLNQKSKSFPALALDGLGVL